MSESWEASCPLDRGQVLKAVKALKTCIAKSGSRQDNDLLEEHSMIQLQVTLHRVPALKKNRMYIDLPHALYPAGAEVCLFTDDVDKDDQEKTEEYYDNLLREKEVSLIAKVIPLMRLKKDYRSYESRRKLVDLYDLFLCDSKIFFRMPALLGKIFFEKRKDPWDVDLTPSKMRKNIDATSFRTRWYLSGNGSCSTITVAKTTFPLTNIVDNIMACAVGVVANAPRGWNNVLSLNIRTDNSIALPVYYNDNPIDVEDLDLRELQYLLRQKKRITGKKKMMNLMGLKKRNRPKRMEYSIRNRREDAKEKAKESDKAGDEVMAVE